MVTKAQRELMREVIRATIARTAWGDAYLEPHPCAVEDDGEAWRVDR